MFSNKFSKTINQLKKTKLSLSLPVYDSFLDTHSLHRQTLFGETNFVCLQTSKPRFVFTVGKYNTNSEKIFNANIKKNKLPVSSSNYLSKTQSINCWYNKNLTNSIELPEKFINLLMMNGNKIKAYNIFYKALKLLEIKTLPTRQNFLFDSKNLLVKAIENIKPSIEVRKVRSRGKTYQVPALIQKNKQETLAVRWIIDSAHTRKKNSKNSFSECLALELLEASKKQGKAKQKRDELHQLAESNRAYLKFRWW